MKVTTTRTFTASVKFIDVVAGEATVLVEGSEVGTQVFKSGDTLDLTWTLVDDVRGAS